MFYKETLSLNGIKSLIYLSSSQLFFFNYIFKSRYVVKEKIVCKVSIVRVCFHDFINRRDKINIKT